MDIGKCLSMKLIIINMKNIRAENNYLTCIKEFFSQI